MINEYLRAARSVGGRLMIDIQPGRSPILDELEYLEPWLPSQTSTSRSTRSGTSAAMASPARRSGA